MNRKVSGAKMVLVPIKNLGRNYFPFVEDLKSRYIKYIDFYKAQYLPDTATAGITSFQNGTMYMTLANEIGNKLLFNHAPLELFDFVVTRGIRQPIGAKLSLQNSYIECNDSNCVGKLAAVIFYYDLPEFSARNKTDKLITDSVSVPITTATFYNAFPDVERMSGKRFRFAQFSPTTLTPELEPGVDTGGVDKLYVTLRKASTNILENIPLDVLYQVLNLEKLEFANIVFDFQSSYVTVGGAGALTSFIGKSVFLNLTYEQ